eukprot:11945323-Alexandrium_andersonii.AAC.1
MLKKRSRPMPAAVDRMQEFRVGTRNLWSLCLAFNQAEPEVLKVKAAVEAMQGSPLGVPVHFHVRYYIMR